MHISLLRTRMVVGVGVIVVLMLTFLAAIALAEPLPRLPADVVVKGGGGPGEVTFSHRAHVDVKKPACTGCHPRVFPILKDGPRAPEPIAHTTMEAGKACGACHNGKAAFGLDECALCHREK